MNSHLTLLSIAIGFSWLGFISIFRSNPDLALRQMAVPTAATAVCVSAISLTLTIPGPFIATLVFAVGLAIAYVFGSIVHPFVSVLISAMGLAVYLQQMM